jgi:hypothetical protein
MDNSLEGLSDDKTRFLTMEFVRFAVLLSNIIALLSAVTFYGAPTDSKGVKLEVLPGASNLKSIQ